MSAPSPCYVTQTPQREFAGAKVVKNFDLSKFLEKNLLDLVKISHVMRDGGKNIAKWDDRKDIPDNERCNRN